MEHLPTLSKDLSSLSFPSVWLTFARRCSCSQADCNSPNPLLVSGGRLPRPVQTYPRYWQYSPFLVLKPAQHSLLIGVYLLQPIMEAESRVKAKQSGARDNESYAGLRVLHQGFAD